MERGDFILGAAAVFGGVLLTMFVEFARLQIERNQRRKDFRESADRESLLQAERAMTEYMLSVVKFMDTVRINNKNETMLSDVEMTELSFPVMTLFINVVSARIKIRSKLVSDAMFAFYDGVDSVFGGKRSDQDIDTVMKMIDAKYMNALAAMGEELRKL